MSTRIFLNISLVISLISCRIDEPDLIDTAQFEFENTIFDSELDHLNFKGPILKKQIENFEPDSDYNIYAWYTKTKNDTLWIYAKVHKQLKEDTSIHFSKNYKELYGELTE